MIPRLAADVTLVAHFAFILFVVLGALLALRWRFIPWLQLPAAGWGAWSEVTGTICPLTHLENAFRHAAGQAGYPSSFIEYHLLGVIYPDGLTREAQWVLAALVVVSNAGIYGWLAHRGTWRRRDRGAAPS